MDQIHDPEIPVLSLNDLGIVRAIEVKSPPTDAGIIEVTITATYSGCPAMDWIASTIQMELKAMGYQSITVKHSISPAWTTDWMSEQGKEKLSSSKLVAIFLFVNLSVSVTSSRFMST